MRKIDKRIDDNTYCWCPHIDLKRDLNGKHLVDFSSEFPFLLKYYTYTSDFSLTRSYHDHLEIIYIYEGEGIFYYEDNQNVVKKGDIVLVSKDRMHLLNATPNKRIKAISLYFQQEFIYRSGGEDLFFDY
ncbi:AraC family ligand binding domain-containing protein, partial [bacterium]|nr:AraC family ligand binding domain-containing protein [bacterium]